MVRRGAVKERNSKWIFMVVVTGTPIFFKPILTVDEILCSPEVLRASEAIQVVLTQMLITPPQALAVEEITRGQHKNPLWYNN